MSLRIFLLTALLGIVQMASPANVPEVSPNKGFFAADLFRQISKSKSTENVILSPISVESALAMTFLGAEGDTAKELQTTLRLASADKDTVGKRFAELFKAKKGEAQLNIANRLFVNSGYALQSKFNELASKYFQSEAETVNFAQSTDAIKTINTWVEKKTNDKITNVMQPGSVNGDTSAVLVNAIYFKGKWQKPFSKDSTRKTAFWVSKTQSVDTEIMYGDEHFRYGEFAELDATAIEMPYKDSDMSMMVILPNERDGLAKLEEKLSTVDITALSSKMSVKSMDMFLPKFKIEYSTGLTDVLKEMGIRAIFEDKANLSGIFQSGPPVKVSDIQHKAFIDVNEAGSEAAAATILKITPMSLDLSKKYFNADHPFVFAIKGAETVYFVGHVAKF